MNAKRYLGQPGAILIDSIYWKVKKNDGTTNIIFWNLCSNWELFSAYSNQSLVFLELNTFMYEFNELRKKKT